MSWWDNSVKKNDEMYPIAIPNQISTISMHIPSGWKSVEIYTSYCPKTKIWMSCRKITLSKIDKIRRLAIPSQISTTAMHIPSLVKMHWHFLKLSSGNENNDVLWADNSVKSWWNLPISNPKPDLYNIDAHTKFGENSLLFTQIIIQKQKIICDMGRFLCQKFTKFTHQLSEPDFHNINALTKFWWKSIDIHSIYHPETKIWAAVQQMDRQTDGQTDNQRETIIPCHYRVAGNKMARKISSVSSPVKNITSTSDISKQLPS